MIPVVSSFLCITILPREKEAWFDAICWKKKKKTTVEECQDFFNSEMKTSRDEMDRVHAIC